MWLKGRSAGFAGNQEMQVITPAAAATGQFLQRLKK
jgi:hypothetical protein